MFNTGALGYAVLWEAVFADVGVALLAVLNSQESLKASADFSVERPSVKRTSEYF